MNRSLLLIICDFLLLSLLALAKFDEPEAKQQAEVAREVRQDTLADQDLIEVLRMSLESERDDREMILDDLEETRRELTERERALQERETKLAETQQRARELESQRAEIAEEAARLDEERQQFAKQFDQAQNRLAEAEADRVALARDLGELKEDSATSREKLRLLQEQMAQKEQALAAAEKDKERLAEEMQAAEQAKQQLSTRLEVAQAESRVLEESLQTARADVEVTRQEKQQAIEQAEKLAEGVTVLAESTDRISEEVKRANPLSLNTIYERYRNNRVTVRFDTREDQLIGTTRRTYEIETSLIAVGDRTFAVLYAADTPFNLSDGGRSLLAADARIVIGNKRFRFGKLYFVAADPRLLVIAMPTSRVTENGIEPFQLAADPLRFPEAVLIDSGNGGYGEIPFKLDPNDKAYLEMQTDLFNRLFGDFSPGRGDSVFSKTGDWIGLMVTGDTSVIVDKFSVDASVSLGDKFNADETRDVLARKRAVLAQLPGSVK